MAAVTNETAEFELHMNRQISVNEYQFPGGHMNGVFKDRVYAVVVPVCTSNNAKIHDVNFTSDLRKWIVIDTGENTSLHIALLFSARPYPQIQLRARKRIELHNNQLSFRILLTGESATGTTMTMQLFSVTPHERRLLAQSDVVVRAKLTTKASRDKLARHRHNQTWDARAQRKLAAPSTSIPAQSTNLIWYDTFGADTCTDLFPVDPLILSN
jgi:hypothetical protein